MNAALTENFVLSAEKFSRLAARAKIKSVSQTNDKNFNRQPRLNFSRNFFRVRANKTPDNKPAGEKIGSNQT